jgi:predicted mannosyl-3-phosphoglycerate phosphatase (HAD superfamily)
LSEEAREFNERQKRYRESEWQHRHTGGRDHRELMEVLRQIEQSLRVLAEEFRGVVTWRRK